MHHRTSREGVHGVSRQRREVGDLRGQRRSEPLLELLAHGRRALDDLAHEDLVASGDDDPAVLGAEQRGEWSGLPVDYGVDDVPVLVTDRSFNADGSFFADVDTGIRCITAPCPSNVRLTGRYTATKSYVRLVAKAGAEPSDYYGRYKYTLAGDVLSLTRTGKAYSGWSNTLDKETSYCAQADDCWSQSIIHPMCMGGWVCGGGIDNQSSNQCGWKCGTFPPPPSNDIYPADATKLVAQTSGGGFTPPPPAGSTCALGAAKYDLDVATRKVTYETCKFVDWQTPLTKQTGTKVLTTAQLAAVNTAAKAMTIATQDICGADKPMLTVTVSSPSQGTKTYKDSFYACQNDGTYVNDIDGVFAAFRQAIGQ